jgi:hypothetical protein
MNDIKIHSTTTTQELLDKIRLTRLRGFDEFPIYEKAEITLKQGVIPCVLSPCQRYVLKDTVETVEKLWKGFKKQHDVDIFKLTGSINFSIDGGPVIPLLPPVVEYSLEEDGTHLIVNDGMHRVYTARALRETINTIFVNEVPSEYPYYAYPLKNKWIDVEEITGLTQGFVKKTYRDASNYKSFYRQFNTQFPGIQETRSVK